MEKIRRSPFFHFPTNQPIKMLKNFQILRILGIAKLRLLPFDSEIIQFRIGLRYTFFV